MLTSKLGGMNDQRGTFKQVECVCRNRGRRQVGGRAYARIHLGMYLKPKKIVDAQDQMETRPLFELDQVTRRNVRTQLLHQQYIVRMKRMRLEICLGSDFNDLQGIGGLEIPNVFECSASVNVVHEINTFVKHF